MKNNQCLGCRSYFQQGQKVPLESMFIQFKNYYLPIKQSKQRWIILKTLVGFLNSKGGTIYIGVQDTQGKVLGLKLSRKQQDQFLLFMKMFIQYIKPAVDLVNKQQISIMYVPVVTNKIFKGKYVIKILVKQGNPSKTYHFIQNIQLQHKGKLQKIEVFHAFYRHNMGGIVQVKGQALLEQIARKAQKPNEISTTFHKFCNPDPLKLDGPLTKIGFSGIRKQQLRLKMQQICRQNLQTFDIDYDVTYDIENQVLLIELQNEQQFKKDLNNNGMFNFIQKGQYLDFYLYKNISNKQSSLSNNSNIENKKHKYGQKIVQDIQKQVTEPNLVKKSSSQTGFASGQIDHQIQQKKSEDELKVQNISLSNEKSKQKQLCDKALQRQYVLTITHINTQKIKALYQYLKNIQNKEYNIKYVNYLRTIQLIFQNRQDVVHFHEILMKDGNKLSQFGVRNNLVVGINMKCIRISNYDKNKKKQLKLFIQSTLKQDLLQVQFKKQNNKYFLQCKLKSRQSTCSWLDKLLDSPQMKQYIIPGALIGKAQKLRIYIYCIVN